MDRIDEIRRLREQGLTIRQIAERTGIPRSTVHKLLKTLGTGQAEAVVSLGQLMNKDIQVSSEPGTKVEPEVDKHKPFLQEFSKPVGMDLLLKLEELDKQLKVITSLVVLHLMDDHNIDLNTRMFCCICPDSLMEYAERQAGWQGFICKQCGWEFPL